jgi:hypothetical protein
VAAAIAASGPMTVEWDRTVFTTWKELRAHLSARGVSSNEFLRRHPAVARTFRLYSIHWAGASFFVRSAFSVLLRRFGVPYASWAARHPLAASRLTA